MGSKYNLEDEFDFYKALKEDDDNGDNGNNGYNENKVLNNCMITHLPLTLNAVTLNCKHSFNYIALYTELCIHNNKKSISCPYCRITSEKYIPFIPLPNVNRVSGVNAPESKCMSAPTCTLILTNGPRKGHVCGKNGVEYQTGVFCVKHTENSSTAANEWTAEMAVLCKTKKIAELKEMLKAKGLKVGGAKKELVMRLLKQ